MTDVDMTPTQEREWLAQFELQSLTRRLVEPEGGWPDGMLIPPLLIVGGLRVRELERWWVDVLDYGYNHRLVVTPRSTPWQWTRGWCFSKTLTSQVEVVLRAGTFDPQAGEEPEGWIKEPGTERRACGWYFHGPKAHQTYVAACPACGDEGLS